MEATKAERERRRVERELKSIAYANAADYAKILETPEEGRWVRLTATEKLRGPQRAAIASIREGRSGVEIKLKDPLKALELLCRLHGLMPADKKNASGGDSLEELLEGLRELDESADGREAKPDDL